MRCLLSFFLVGLLGLWTTAASAQNLIVNGGFETNGGPGSAPTGWTSSNGVEGAGFDGLAPHSGSWFLAFGAVGGDAFTTQTITTTPGAVYDLQFFYVSDGGTPGDLNVTWNGVNIYSELNNGTAHPYQQHDIFVTGTGSDTLSFGGRNDPTWNGLDDVSLVGVGVPEPATLALMSIAGGALGGGLWWNRKRSQRRRFTRKSAQLKTV